MTDDPHKTIQAARACDAGNGPERCADISNAELLELCDIAQQALEECERLREDWNEAVEIASERALEIATHLNKIERLKARLRDYELYLQDEPCVGAEFAAAPHCGICIPCKARAFLEDK